MGRGEAARLVGGLVGGAPSAAATEGRDGGRGDSGRSFFFLAGCAEAAPECDEGGAFSFFARDGGSDCCFCACTLPKGAIGVLGPPSAPPSLLAICVASSGVMSTPKALRNSEERAVANSCASPGPSAPESVLLLLPPPLLLPPLLLLPLVSAGSIRQNEEGNHPWRWPS